MQDENVIALAGCILTNEYGRILLLHRESRGNSQWELPGGKVEDGEAPETTAIREAYEELGVRISITGRACINEFELDDESYKYHCFYATVINGELQIKEAEIFNDLDYVDPEDLASLALSQNMLELQNKIFSGEVVLEP